MDKLKVVCINRNDNYTHHRKLDLYGHYDAEDFKDNSVGNIVVGAVLPENGDKHTYILMKDTYKITLDGKFIGFFYKSMFVPLAIWRESQIDSILED